MQKNFPQGLKPDPRKAGMSELKLQPPKGNNIFRRLQSRALTVPEIRAAPFDFAPHHSVWGFAQDTSLCSVRRIQVEPGALSPL